MQFGQLLLTDSNCFCFNGSIVDISFKYFGAYPVYNIYYGCKFWYMTNP